MAASSLLQCCDTNRRPGATHRSQPTRRQLGYVSICALDSEVVHCTGKMRFGVILGPNQSVNQSLFIA